MSVEEQFKLNNKLWPKGNITSFVDNLGVETTNDDFNLLTSLRLARILSNGAVRSVGIGTFERPVGKFGIKKINAMGRVDENGDTHAGDTMVIHVVKE